MDVIFVHGWGCNPSVWGDLVKKLTGITPHYVDLGFVSGFEGASQDLP